MRNCCYLSPIARLFRLCELKFVSKSWAAWPWRDHQRPKPRKMITSAVDRYADASKTIDLIGPSNRKIIYYTLGRDCWSLCMRWKTQKKKSPSILKKNRSHPNTGIGDSKCAGARPTNWIAESQSDNAEGQNNIVGGPKINIYLLFILLDHRPLTRPAKLISTDISLCWSQVPHQSLQNYLGHH